MAVSLTVVFACYCFSAIRGGFFKTLQRLTGREPEEGAAEEGKADTADPPTVVTLKPVATSLAIERHDSLFRALRLCCHRTSKRPLPFCLAGSCARLNPHRKADLIWTILMVVTYAVAVSVVLYAK